MRIGFVGLGNQGAPIAQRIVAGGFDTSVWARRPEALDDFRDGPARIPGSLPELGKDLSVLFSCLFDAAGNREVLFGPNGVARSMPAGSLIVIHSTLAPAEVLELARLASTEFGLRLVDAPVSGGAIKAAHGEMVVMLGGDPADVEECRPVLATFASRIIYLGPVGAGQQAKLINNAALSAHLGIASDAMAVGAEFGLDRAALAEVLVNGSGRSYGIEMLAGAGGLSAVARTQARPTLGKDVRLLAEVLNDSAAGGSLLAVAGKTVDRLDGLSAEPG